MRLHLIHILLAALNLSNLLAENGTFPELDRNSDRFLSPDELSDPDQDAIEHSDDNADGKLDRREFKAYQRYQKMIAEDRKLIPAGAKALKDIAYVENGHRRQQLDIYYPPGHDGKEALPLVIYIHGGAWKKWSKERAGLPSFLVEHGFAVASISYRLSSQAIYPAQIHDSKAAVRFLRKNAKKFGVDPERFGVWGLSAGGHLACLVGAGADQDEIEGALGTTGVSSRVQAVCSWFGPTDVLKMQPPHYDSPIKVNDPRKRPLPILLGGLISEKLELARLASGISFVSKDDPPFLFMHGDSDPLVPPSQSISMHEKLQAAGVESNLVLVKDVKHARFTDPKEIEKVATFFAKHLKDKKLSNNNEESAYRVHAPFNKEYSPDQLGKVLWWEDTGKAISATTVHRGLLIVPMSFDFGGGEGHGAFAAYNIDDPENPVCVFDSRKYPKIYHDEDNRNYLGDIGEAHGIFIHEDKIFFQEKGHDDAGFCIFDLGPLYDNDPKTLPQVVCRYAFPGVERTTIYDGFTFAAAWVGGKYVYAPTGSTGLYIIDTQDLNDPKLLTHFSKEELYNQIVRSVHPLGDLLILSPAAVAAAEDDMVIMDVSNPSNPTLVSHYPVRVGYQGIVYGPVFYNGAFAADRGADKVSEIIAYDFSDPHNIKETLLGKPENELYRVEYAFIQDDDLFIGHYPGLSKWTLQDGKYVRASNSSVEPQLPPSNDYGFVSPLGNLGVVGSDHDVQSKLSIGVHTMKADRKGPTLLYAIPKMNQSNVSILTKVGLSFSDWIDTACLDHGAIVMRERGSDKEIDCGLSHGLGVIHLVPREPLELNTTYDVYASPTLYDMVGNSYEGDSLLTTFSTGAAIADYKCQIITDTPRVTGEKVQLKSAVNNPKLGATLLYSWKFGDDNKATAFSTDSTAQYIFNKPGNYNISLTTKQAGSEKTMTSSAVQVVHAKLPQSRPSSSSSLALDDSTNRLYVVNPDNNTLTALNTKTGETIYEQTTGNNPVSLVSVGEELWISCHKEDHIAIHNKDDGKRIKDISLAYGTAPHGLCKDHEGKHVYVALSTTGQLQEISTQSHLPTRTLQLEGPLRHLALLPEKDSLVAPQFMADGQKGGKVNWINLGDWSLDKVETLEPTMIYDDTANGRGYPNYLGSIAVNPEQTKLRIAAKKDNLFRGLQRDGEPLVFDHTVRSITVTLDAEGQKENTDQRIDLDNSDFATATAYNAYGNIFYVATMGSSTINAVDAYEAKQVSTYNTYGKGAMSIATNSDGSRVYVHNQLSRSIAVFDAKPDGGLKYNTKWPTVSKELLSTGVLNGKRIFHDTSRSHLSREGYMSCASCHIDGSHDGRVWDLSSLGEGLRNTIDLRGKAGMKHGILHWSGNFDEVQDFDDQIRLLNEGTGYIADSVKKPHRSLLSGKAGVTIELDDLARYVSSLSEYPRSPHKNSDGSMTEEATKGRQHFINLKCYTCHSGPTFTDSNTGKRHDVGTHSATSGTRLEKPFTEFDTPTVIGLWQSAPYLHDGSAHTLSDVFEAGTGTEAQAHQVAKSISETEQSELIAFLMQLDSEEYAISGSDLKSTNKPPKFVQSKYTFNHVYRHDRQTHIVGSVSAKDQDPGQSLSYRIAPGLYSTLFEINTQTGELNFLFKDIYFRDIANKLFSENRTYSLTVITEDDGDFIEEDRAEVTVNVLYPDLPFSNPDLNKLRIYTKRLDDKKHFTPQLQQALDQYHQVISDNFEANYRDAFSGQ